MKHYFLHTSILIDVLANRKPFAESAASLFHLAEKVSQSLSSDFSDFEDAIQYNTAVSDKKIIAIVTRNVKDYKWSKITVLTPDEVLSTLANE